MRLFQLFVIASCSVLLASIAWAAADQAGSTIINEPNGFPGVCDAPCFTVEKTFEVYLSGNPTVPAGANCPVGDNTYIYTLTHKGGSGTPSGFIPALTKFEQTVDAADVTSVGEIPGFGIDPSSTSIGANVVAWDFVAPTIAATQSSTKLFLCSALLPGLVTDNMVSVDGQAGLDAPGTCLGPKRPDGNPMPCTIGFWKNRANGKPGTLQHFPDGEFDQVVTQAVSLSGEFATEQELLDALLKQGKRTDAERRSQQLAATLLNFAAADLFPENNKCALFETNLITSNACGDNITVEEALDKILNGGFATIEEAKDCADDLNNGVGIPAVVEGE